MSAPHVVVLKALFVSSLIDIYPVKLSIISAPITPTFGLSSEEITMVLNKKRLYTALYPSAGGDRYAAVELLYELIRILPTISAA